MYYRQRHVKYYDSESESNSENTSNNKQNNNFVDESNVSCVLFIILVVMVLVNLYHSFC